MKISLTEEELLRVANEELKAIEGLEGFQVKTARMEGDRLALGIAGGIAQPDAYLKADEFIRSFSDRYTLQV